MFTFILLCICNFIQSVGDFVYQNGKYIPLIEVQVVWPNSRRTAARQTVSLSSFTTQSVKERTSPATHQARQATEVADYKLKAIIDKQALEWRLASAYRDIEHYKAEDTRLQRALTDKENLLWDDPNRLRVITIGEELQRKKGELEQVHLSYATLKDVAKETEIANFELRSHVHSLTSRLKEASTELDAYRQKDLDATSLCLKFGTAVMQHLGVYSQDMDAIYARCAQVVEAEVKSSSPRPLLCMSCCQLSNGPSHTQAPPSPALSAASSYSSGSEEGATRVRRGAPADGEYDGDVESASEYDSDSD
ncbi:hypothetical protein CPB85DRAFT_216621 [Mucidula mucida]|nr:hypothetical protein CPB85DRAFT_216621 [Mucidula mucida]